MREIGNEVRERTIHERIEQIERQIETLIAILHELRDGQRRIGGGSLGNNQDVPEPNNRAN